MPLENDYLRNQAKFVDIAFNGIPQFSIVDKLTLNHNVLQVSQDNYACVRSLSKLAIYPLDHASPNVTNSSMGSPYSLFAHSSTVTESTFFRMDILNSLEDIFNPTKTLEVVEIDNQSTATPNNEWSVDELSQSKTNHTSRKPNHFSKSNNISNPSEISILTPHNVSSLVQALELPHTVQLNLLSRVGGQNLKSYALRPSLYKSLPPVTPVPTTLIGDSEEQDLSCLLDISPSIFDSVLSKMENGLEYLHQRWWSYEPTNQLSVIPPEFTCSKWGPKGTAPAASSSCILAVGTRQRHKSLVLLSPSSDHHIIKFRTPLLTNLMISILSRVQTAYRCLMEALLAIDNSGDDYLVPLINVQSWQWMYEGNNHLVKRNILSETSLDNDKSSNVVSYTYINDICSVLHSIIPHVGSLCNLTTIVSDIAFSPAINLPYVSMCTHCQSQRQKNPSHSKNVSTDHICECRVETARVCVMTVAMKSGVVMMWLVPACFTNSGSESHTTPSTPSPDQSSVSTSSLLLSPLSSLIQTLNTYSVADDPMFKHLLGTNDLTGAMNSIHSVYPDSYLLPKRTHEKSHLNDYGNIPLDEHKSSKSKSSQFSPQKNKHDLLNDSKSSSDSQCITSQIMEASAEPIWSLIAPFPYYLGTIRTSDLTDTPTPTSIQSSQFSNVGVQPSSQSDITDTCDIDSENDAEQKIDQENPLTISSNGAIIPIFHDPLTALIDEYVPLTNSRECVGRGIGGASGISANDMDQVPGINNRNYITSLAFNAHPEYEYMHNTALDPSDSTQSVNSIYNEGVSGVSILLALGCNDGSRAVARVALPTVLPSPLHSEASHSETNAGVEYGGYNVNSQVINTYMPCVSVVGNKHDFHIDTRLDINNLESNMYESDNTDISDSNSMSDDDSSADPVPDIINNFTNFNENTPFQPISIRRAPIFNITWSTLQTGSNLNTVPSNTTNTHLVDSNTRYLLTCSQENRLYTTVILPQVSLLSPDSLSTTLPSTSIPHTSIELAVNSLISYSFTSLNVSHCLNREIVSICFNGSISQHSHTSSLIMNILHQLTQSTGSSGTSDCNDKLIGVIHVGGVEGGSSRLCVYDIAQTSLIIPPHSHPSSTDLDSYDSYDDNFSPSSSSTKSARNIYIGHPIYSHASDFTHPLTTNSTSIPSTTSTSTSISTSTSTDPSSLPSMFPLLDSVNPDVPAYSHTSYSSDCLGLSLGRCVLPRVSSVPVPSFNTDVKGDSAKLENRENREMLRHLTNFPLYLQPSADNLMMCSVRVILQRDDVDHLHHDYYIQRKLYETHTKSEDDEDVDFKPHFHHDRSVNEPTSHSDQSILDSLSTLSLSDNTVYPSLTPLTDQVSVASQLTQLYALKKLQLKYCFKLESLLFGGMGKTLVTEEDGFIFALKSNKPGYDNSDPKEAFSGICVLDTHNPDELHQYINDYVQLTQHTQHTTSSDPHDSSPCGSPHNSLEVKPIPSVDILNDYIDTRRMAFNSALSIDLLCLKYKFHTHVQWLLRWLLHSPTTYHYIPIPTHEKTAETYISHSYISHSSHNHTITFTQHENSGQYIFLIRNNCSDISSPSPLPSISICTMPSANPTSTTSTSTSTSSSSSSSSSSSRASFPSLILTPSSSPAPLSFPSLFRVMSFIMANLLTQYTQFLAHVTSASFRGFDNNLSDPKTKNNSPSTNTQRQTNSNHNHNPALPDSSALSSHSYSSHLGFLISPFTDLCTVNLNVLQPYFRDLCPHCAHEKNKDEDYPEDNIEPSSKICICQNGPLAISVLEDTSYTNVNKSVVLVFIMSILDSSLIQRLMHCSESVKPRSPDVSNSSPNISTNDKCTDLLSTSIFATELYTSMQQGVESVLTVSNAPSPTLPYIINHTHTISKISHSLALSRHILSFTTHLLSPYLFASHLTPYVQTVSSFRRKTRASDKADLHNRLYSSNKSDSHLLEVNTVGIIGNLVKTRVSANSGNTDEDEEELEEDSLPSFSISRGDRSVCVEYLLGPRMIRNNHSKTRPIVAQPPPPSTSHEVNHTVEGHQLLITNSAFPLSCIDNEAEASLNTNVKNSLIALMSLTSTLCESIDVFWKLMYMSSSTVSNITVITPSTFYSSPPSSVPSMYPLVNDIDNNTPLFDQLRDSIQQTLTKSLPNSPHSPHILSILPHILAADRILTKLPLLLTHVQNNAIFTKLPSSNTTIFSTLLHKYHHSHSHSIQHPYHCLPPYSLTCITQAAHVSHTPDSSLDTPLEDVPLLLTPSVSPFISLSIHNPAFIFSLLPRNISTYITTYQTLIYSLLLPLTHLTYIGASHIINNTSVSLNKTNLSTKPTKRSSHSNPVTHHGFALRSSPSTLVTFNDSFFSFEHLHLLRISSLISRFIPSLSPVSLDLLQPLYPLWITPSQKTMYKHGFMGLSRMSRDWSRTRIYDIPTDIDAILSTSKSLLNNSDLVISLHTANFHVCRKILIDNISIYQGVLSRSPHMIDHFSHTILTQESVHLSKHSLDEISLLNNPNSLFHHNRMAFYPLKPITRTCPCCHNTYASVNLAKYVYVKHKCQTITAHDMNMLSDNLQQPQHCKDCLTRLL